MDQDYHDKKRDLFFRIFSFDFSLSFYSGEKTSLNIKFVKKCFLK